MKVILQNIAQADVVVGENFNGTIRIESGEAIFLIRELSTQRLTLPMYRPVFLNEPDPVRRNTIEPYDNGSFTLTQHVFTDVKEVDIIPVRTRQGKTIFAVVNHDNRNEEKYCYDDPDVLRDYCKERELTIINDFGGGKWLIP